MIQFGLYYFRRNVKPLQQALPEAKALRAEMLDIHGLCVSVCQWPESPSEKSEK